MQKIYSALMALTAILFSFNSICQSNPVPQILPYTQNFEELSHNISIYPAGWQGWTIGSSNSSSFRTVSPTGDRAMTASGHAGLNSGAVYNYNGKIGFLTTGSLDLALALAINTTGKTNISVSYDAMTIRNPYDGGSNTRINEMTLQYRIGTSGTFTTLTGIEYQNNTTTQTTSNVTTPQNVQTKTIILPSACNDQPVIQIRWVNRDASGAGARPGFAVDNILISSETTASKTINVSFETNAAEPSTNGNFIINFSSPTTETTNLDFAITGTATFGSDYTVSYSAGTTTSTSSSGTLSVPAGTSSITVSVNTLDDLEFEGTESVILTLSNPTSDYVIGTSSASINIIDNDAPPTVSVTAGAHAAEPSTNGTFNINLSAPAPPGGVTVGYTFSGSATLGIDYNDPLNGNINIPEGSSTGTINITVTDDEILEGSETIDITLTGVSNGFILGSPTARINLIDNEIAPVPKVVINEVYGGGGNSGATYKNDFIELYNNEDYAVNLNGWSIQYASSAGNFGGSTSKTDLSGTIPAKGYYLIQQAAGSGGTANLPTPDASGTINMSGTGGKVALVNNTTLLIGPCPINNNIIDFVGFGNANCYEGLGSTIAPSNIASVQRKIKGFDTNDNKADFETITPPTPRNSIADITPPVITSTYPANNETNILTSFIASITFNENVTKGAGYIVLKNNGGSVITSFDVTHSDVRVTGSTVNINIQGLSYNSDFYIEITPGAFIDASDNEFAGINDATTWSFSTASVPPVGSLNYTYDFNVCNTNLPNGFTQYSEEGSVIWGCTTFGKDANNLPAGSAPNGLQINGFINGANQVNTDWLISPAFEVTNTNYPILSFWSRNAFTGSPLKLVVSTDYTGWGDPTLATWTELNGKFPGTATDVWTISDNINLSKYKGSAVYIAFIYSSSSDDGARWTLDDITIRNDNNPPAPSLTVLANDVQFIYVKAGETDVKEISFAANDLVEDVIVSASSDFYVSKDGLNFATSVTYTVAEANDVFSKLYIQFAPGAENQSYSGTVTLSTSSAMATINLQGSSIDPAITLEVVNWNVEWFGSTVNGPRNEDLQEQNVVKIMKEVNADVYGLMEIVDEAKLARVVDQLEGYAYTISDFGSHVNPYSGTNSTLAEAQKLAFVYKTSVISVNEVRPMLAFELNTEDDAKNNPSFYNWSSGRYPYLMDADVTLGGKTKNIKFVLVHAKANTAPLGQSYERRKAGADALHDSLKRLWPDQEIIMLGDFNDDLDVSITTGYTTTSWNKFTEDSDEYNPLTLPLSLAGKKSTVSYNDIIDHVVVSNEMNRWYMTSTANILSDVTGLVSNYGSTTSDHYPVFSRYIYCNITPPDNIVVSNDEGKCGAVVTYNFITTQTCGTVTADIESGSFFEAGTHTVTLTSSYGDIATFTVTVNDTEKPTISAPETINVKTDEGKCYASISLLGAPITGDNCGVESVTNDAPSTFTTGSTTVIWKVTDIHGNISTAEQIINVTDEEMPVITPPAGIIINSDAGKCYATISTLGTPITDDNCGIESVTNDAPSTFIVGNTTVTWFIKDINGNIATAEQIVIVNDAELPLIISCPSVPVQCYNSNNSYIIPVITASDNCGIDNIQYSITGATTRSGYSNNASGTFNIGTNTITWNITDVNGNQSSCITTVIINSPIISSIPDAYSITPGGTANTVYIGYEPASTITLNASVSGGTAPYSYKWTIGTSSGRGFSNNDSVTVNPTTTSTYFMNVEDVYGCVTEAVTKTIFVNDVRCGPKNDRVSICQLSKGKWTTSCIQNKDVPSLLAAGATLGSCSNTNSTLITFAEPVMEGGSKEFEVQAMPNPSSGYFNIRIHSENNSDRIFVRISDILGRTVEQFQNLPSTHILRVGDNYRNGVYLVEVIQGSSKKHLKIIKNQ